MGALPKRKISKGRRNRRRANDALAKPQISKCPKCKKAKRPHFVCGFCGYYGDGSDLKKNK
ncbi:MAG: 50S ribosomal protein L32 [Candidatus Dojkabacteria bacterium]